MMKTFSRRFSCGVGCLVDCSLLLTMFRRHYPAMKLLHRNFLLLLHSVWTNCSASSSFPPLLASSLIVSEHNFWGLPTIIRDAYRQRGITEFYDWQKVCLNSPPLLGGKNFLYSLPTSGGKVLLLWKWLYSSWDSCCRNFSIKEFQSTEKDGSLCLTLYVINTPLPDVILLRYCDCNWKDEVVREFREKTWFSRRRISWIWR